MRKNSSRDSMLHKVDFDFINLCFLKKVMKIVQLIALISTVYFAIISRSTFRYRKPIYSPIVGGLNTYDVVLENGDNYHLYVFGVNHRVTFRSSDIKVATINLLGTIRTWRPGTTIIYVKYGEKELKCRVRVIQISKKRMKLSVGERKHIKVKGAVFGVKYKSSDQSVVTVNPFGKVEAVGKGKAVVTASYKGKKLTCKVVVE